LKLFSTELPLHRNFVVLLLTKHRYFCEIDAGCKT